MSDTMVSDPNSTGPEVMPGRLKAVTIGYCATVAYTGRADPATVAVQEAHRELCRAGLVAAMEALKDASRDSYIDFVVASHRTEPSLVRLRRGVSLEVKDICALGDEEPFRALIDQARGANGTEPLEHSNLRMRFTDRLLTNKDLGKNIGGFPIAVKATSSAHRYRPLSDTYIYEFPILHPGKETHQPIEQVYTGSGHFSLSVIPSPSMNIPVVGACLLQARMGYVFSPLEQPHAYSVPLAPSDLEWEGQEQQMFDGLRQALVLLGKLSCYTVPESNTNLPAEVEGYV